MAKRSANNYFKNVARSIGHTASNSVSNELNSTLEFISSNTSTIREEIGEAKNLKEFIKIKSTPFDEYKKMLKEGLKNAKEDLKTGKFYNQERLESVGMDDDNMFDDDFFDDFEDSFDLGEDVDLDGASITINKIDMNATEKSPLVKATKATTDAIITTSKASNKLMSSLTETTISAIIESNESTNKNLSTVNENIGSLISFNNGIVSKFIESSQKYYEDSLKLLSEQVSELKKLTEVKGEETYKGYDPTQVFLSGGGLDIKSYLGMVKRNTGNAIDETPGLSMIKAMMSDKDNMKLFLASPLQMVTDTIAEKLVPELAKQSMATFDKTFSEFFPALLSKISGLRDSDNPLYALAGRIFGVTPNTKSSIDLGNYNKKAVPFDGYVRKSIVEVIPGYLRKIEAALTGREERAFDLAKGKWRSAYGMRDEFDNKVNDAMLSNFYDIRYAMTKNANFLNANGEDMHLGEKIDKLLLKLATDSSITGVTTSKSDYGKKGFKDLREVLESLSYDGFSYSQDDINAIIAMYNNLPRNQKMALNGRARQNAISARKKILEEAEQNPYEYNAQFSKYSGDEIDTGRNKKDKNWRPTGIQDKFGQTSLSYLRNIQTMLANGIKVYTNGNREKGEGGGAYNPNESFLNHMTYQEKQYYDSMYRRSATPLTEEQIARKRSIGTVVFGAGQDFSAEEIQRKLAEVDKPVNPNDNMISKAMDEISKTKAGKMGQSAQEKLNDWKYAVQSVFTAPARMIAGVFDRMDNTLYNVVFGSEDGDDSNSFMNKALSTFKVKMNDLGEWFKDKLFGKNGLFTQVKESDLYDMLGAKGKDIKENLLGELDESTDLRSGGILSETSNELHDVTRTMKAFFTGKEWIDSKGVKHDATENAVFPELTKDFNGLKDIVKSYLFGDKNDADGEGKKGGLVKGALNSLSDGFKTLGEALFGPSEYIATGPDGRAKVYRNRMSDEMKDFGKNLKERAPKMAAGGITGFIGGALAGSSGLGLLGSLFLPGGPIGGAIIGSTVGYLSQSEKFKNWLFGEKDKETGERVGNVISAKTQKFFKENKVPIVGGAAVGFLKGALGIGFLPSFLLPGGPIGGALMGAGFGILKRSDTFQNFLFGPKDSEGKRRSNKGLLGSIFGKMRADKNAGKVAGTAAAGAISGAALSSVIGSFGIMGAALTPLGPLGGALVGAALGITAASNKWKEKVFGTFNKDTGKKEGGLMGQFRNWTKLNVFAPLKLSGQQLALNIKDWFIDGIAMPFMNAAEPIKHAVVEMAVKTKDMLKTAGSKLLGGIDNIFKKVDKRINGFFGKVGRLIWKGVKGLATNPFKLAGKVISAPFKLAERAALRHEEKSKRKGLKYYWTTKTDENGNPILDKNGNPLRVRHKRNIIDRAYGVFNREERQRRKSTAGVIVDKDGNVISNTMWDDIDQRRYEREQEREQQRSKDREEMRTKQTILNAVRAKARGENYVEGESDNQYSIDSLYDILNMDSEELKAKFGDKLAGYSNRKMKRLTKKLLSTNDKRAASALENRDVQNLLKIAEEMGKEKREKAIEEQAQSYIREALPEDLDTLKETMSELNESTKSGNDTMAESLKEQKSIGEKISDIGKTLKDFLHRTFGINITDDDGLSHGRFSAESRDYLAGKQRARDRLKAREKRARSHSIQTGTVEGDGFVMRDGGQGGFGTPYYSQKDPRWSGINYNKLGRFGITGCGPTAMSMIAGGFGKNINPAIMGAYAKSKGYSDSAGTNWNFVNSASNAAGLHATQSVHPSESFIMNELANGKPVLLSGAGGYGTPYTNAGHYVVATGLDANGNPIISDPRGPEYSGIYSAKSTLNSTNSAWRFKRGGFGLLSGVGKVAKTVGDAKDKIDSFKDSKVGSLLYKARDIASGIYGKASKGYNTLQDALLGSNYKKLANGVNNTITASASGLSGLKATASPFTSLTNSYNGSLSRAEANRLGAGISGTNGFKRYLKGVSATSQGASSAMYSGLEGESEFTNSVSREDSANHQATEAPMLPMAAGDNITTINNNYFMNDESDNSTNDNSTDSPLETVGTAAMAALTSLPVWLKTGITTIGKAAKSILNILKNPLKFVITETVGTAAAVKGLISGAIHGVETGAATAAGKAGLVVPSNVTEKAATGTALATTRSTAAKDAAAIAVSEKAAIGTTANATPALEAPAKGETLLLEDKYANSILDDIRYNSIYGKQKETAKVGAVASEKATAKASANATETASTTGFTSDPNFATRTLEQADSKEYNKIKNSYIKDAKKNGVNAAWDDSLTIEQNVDDITRQVYEKNHPNISSASTAATESTIEIVDSDGSIITIPEASYSNAGSSTYKAGNYIEGVERVTGDVIDSAGNPIGGKESWWSKFKNRFFNKESTSTKAVKTDTINFNDPNFNARILTTKNGKVIASTVKNGDSMVMNGLTVNGSRASINPLLNIGAVGINEAHNGGYAALAKDTKTIGQALYSAATNKLLASNNKGLQTVGKAMETGAAKKAATKEAISKVTKEVTEKVSSSAIGKFIDFVKKIIKSLVSNSKLAKLIGEKGAKVLEKTMNSKIMTKLSEKALAPFSAKISAALAKIATKTGTEAVTLGIGTAVFATYGAVTGALDASNLFHVSNDEVTTPMRAISSIIKAWIDASPIVGPILDVLNEIFKALSNIDVKSFIACEIYKGYCNLFDKEAGETFKAAQSSFKEDYQAFKEKTGIDDLTENEYNDAKNKTSEGKMFSAVGKGLSKMGGFLGGTKAETYYTDEDGNKYSDNGDGSYTVYDSKGSKYGTTTTLPENVKKTEVSAKEGIAENAYKAGVKGVKNIVNSELDYYKSIGNALIHPGETWKKLKNDPTGTLKSAGKKFVNRYIERAKTVSNVGKGLAQDAGKLASKAGNALKIGAKNFFTRDTKKVYYLTDGSGKYYQAKDDGTYELCNVNGDVMPVEHISDTELYTLMDNAQVKAGTKVVRDFAIVEASKKLGNIVSKGFKKGFNATSKFFSSIGSKAGKLASSAASAVAKTASNIGAFFGGRKDKVWYDESGNYYATEDNGKSYTYYQASGTPISNITVDEFTELLKTNPLVEKAITTEKNILGKLGNGFSKVGKAASSGFNKASKAITGLFKSIGSKAGNLANKVGSTADKIKNNIGSFLLGKKETRYYDAEGNYYSVNKGNISYYSSTGSLLSENIDINDLTDIIPTLTEQTITVEKNVLEKAGSGIVNIGSKSAKAFSKGLKAVAGAFRTIGTKVSEKFSALTAEIKEKGIGGYLSGKLNSAKTAVVDFLSSATFEGYISPDGSYYIREKDGWTHCSATHSRLETGISDEVFNEKYKPLLTYKADIKKQSGMSDAFNKIQDKISSAWSSAKDTVGNAWDSFTSWISGKGETINEDISGVTAVGQGTGGRGKGKFFGIGGGKGDEANNFPYFSQKDARWGNTSYSANDGGTLADNGCGPTAMAMIVKGMRGDVNPKQIADYTKAKGYNDSTGTNWNFVSDTASQYGLSSAINIKPTQKALDSQIANGPVLLSGRGGNGTPYTNAGHYVVAVGKDNAGNYIINDPRGKQYSGKYSAKDLVNSTNAAWSFTNGGRGTVRMSRILGGKGGNSFTAADVIAVAKNEVGYVEKASNNNLDSKTANPGKSNYTKYERDVFGSNGNYWCASFVSWCFYTAAGKNKNKATSILLSLTRSADGMMTAFKNKKQFTTSNPQPGDVIFFSGSRHAGANHVGIVTNVDSGKVYTVEGNTSVGTGVVDNGGGVAEKSYPLATSRILGYGRPNYDGTSNFSGINSSDSSSSSKSATSLDSILSIFDDALNSGVWKSWGFSSNPFEDSSNSSSNSSNNSSLSSSAVTSLSGSSIKNMTGSSFRTADLKSIPFASQEQIASALKGAFINGHPTSVFTSANLDKDAKGIYEAQGKSGLSALVPLAIGALESGWGTSDIARDKGNLWGLTKTVPKKSL